MPRQLQRANNRRLRVTHSKDGTTYEFVPVASTRDAILSENTVHYALPGGGITQLPNLMRHYQDRGFLTRLID